RRRGALLSGVPAPLLVPATERALTGEASLRAARHLRPGPRVARDLDLPPRRVEGADLRRERYQGGFDPRRVHPRDLEEPRARSRGHRRAPVATPLASARSGCGAREPRGAHVPIRSNRALHPPEFRAPPVLHGGHRLGRKMAVSLAEPAAGSLPRHAFVLDV